MAEAGRVMSLLAGVMITPLKADTITERNASFVADGCSHVVCPSLANSYAAWQGEILL